MVYLATIMVLPALYIAYLIFHWLYTRENNKKNRVHFTKKTVWLILLSWLAIFFLHRILFNILSHEKESFWLYSLIYFLGTAVITGYLYISIKATKSRKNLTKLLIYISLIALFTPLIWWNYQVYRVGIFDGRFGINRKTALNYTENFIGPKINHSFKQAEIKDEYWLVTENLRTFDSKNDIDVKFKVDRKNGQVNYFHSDTVVPVHITRANGNGDSLEMMFFVDRSGDPKKPDLEKLQYANSDQEGNTKIAMQTGTELKYYLQVRDCSFSCTSFVFKLKAPIKDRYDIVINSYQPLTEI